MSFFTGFIFCFMHLRFPLIEKSSLIHFFLSLVLVDFCNLISHVVYYRIYNLKYLIFIIMQFNSFLARGYFLRLLINFANNMDPDQD